MDPGKLDMFEHSANYNCSLRGILELPDIGYAIDIHLDGVLKKFIHEYGSFGRGFDSESHVMLQFGIGVNNLHGATAENKAWPDEDWIPEHVRRFQRFRFVCRDAV